MNLQSVNRWIHIVKRVIISSKRKSRNERQHKLTKYFTLKITAKNSSVTKTIPIKPQKNFHQLPIHQFLSTNSTNSSSERNSQTTPFSRRNNIVLHQQKEYIYQHDYHCKRILSPTIIIITSNADNA